MSVKKNVKLLPLSCSTLSFGGSILLACTMLETSEKKNTKISCDQSQSFEIVILKIAIALDKM